MCEGGNREGAGGGAADDGADDGYGDDSVLVFDDDG